MSPETPCPPAQSFIQARPRILAIPWDGRSTPQLDPLPQHGWHRLYPTEAIARPSDSSWHLAKQPLVHFLYMPLPSAAQPVNTPMPFEFRYTFPVFFVPAAVFKVCVLKKTLATRHLPRPSKPCFICFIYLFYLQTIPG